METREALLSLWIYLSGIPDKVRSDYNAVNDLHVAILVTRHLHLLQAIFQISANFFFHRVSPVRSKISGTQLIKF